MALVRCPDCGKSISDKAVSCNACGCPVGGGSSSAGNVAFENRIEQYKANGYKLEKRNGNTVQMIKQLSAKRAVAYILISLGIPATLLVVFFIINLGYTFSGIFTPICAYVLCFIFISQGAKARRVNISITTTGKIEEEGNVLKKK